MVLMLAVWGEKSKKMCNPKGCPRGGLNCGLTSGFGAVTRPFNRTCYWTQCRQHDDLQVSQGTTGMVYFVLWSPELSLRDLIINYTYIPWIFLRCLDFCLSILTRNRLGWQQWYQVLSLPSPCNLEVGLTLYFQAGILYVRHTCTDVQVGAGLAHLLSRSLRATHANHIWLSRNLDQYEQTCRHTQH